MIKQRFRYFIGKGTLTIFDIDETLFHTRAEILVVKGGKTVAKLDNQVFNTYKLKDGESFDYGQFKSAQIFKTQATPVTNMIDKAKRVVKTNGNSHSRAIIVTARADLDDKEMFLQTFRDHGINIDAMHIERTGNLGLSSPAEAKKVVFRKYLNTRNYIKVRLYDDAMSNLKAFLDLKKEYPEITFQAYLVDSSGKTKEIK